MVKIYQQPFAHAGTKQAIPDASDPQGFVSNEDGFTTDYELPDTDPNYKPIERAEFNGLMNMVTESLGEMQQFGFAKWQPITWPQGANVNHDGGVWQSLSNSNTEEPGAGALWKPILFDRAGQSTESVLGLVQLATTAEAQALTDDTKALTPAKLAAAFGGANQGLAANGYQKLPGGLIYQWGKTPAFTAGAGVTVTLPISFPNACNTVTASPGDVYGPTNIQSSTPVYVQIDSLSQITIKAGGAGSLPVYWLAIGY